MNFCDRTTTYTIFRDRESKEPPREWLTRLLPTMADPLISIQCMVEIQWLEAGRPYYAVYPVIADALRRVRLDLPCEAITPPMDRWVIRFPEPGIEINGRHLRSICVPLSTRTDRNGMAPDWRSMLTLEKRNHSDRGSVLSRLFLPRVRVGAGNHRRRGLERRARNAGQAGG